MLSEEQLVPFLKTLYVVARDRARDLKFPGADTLLTELTGQVLPLFALEDIVHACASSYCVDFPEMSKMLHNVKKNNIDLFEVHLHVSFFRMHVHVQLQINLKCADARPQII